MTIDKWGEVASFLMGAFFAIAPLIYLTGYLQNVIDGKCASCRWIWCFCRLFFFSVAGIVAQYFIFFTSEAIGKTMGTPNYTHLKQATVHQLGDSG